jgi:N-acetylmuramoyl-L-alanine amidase
MFLKKEHIFKNLPLAAIFQCSIILFCLLSFVSCMPARVSRCDIKINKKYVVMDETRDRLSLDYIREHYNLTPRKPHIEPRIIVLHWTAIHSFDASYQTMYPSVLPSKRKDIASASSLNVCAHFLVDRDGSIYQLLPLPYFGRHVIGLNYHAIGVENVGSDTLPLTDEQVTSNTALIFYLLEKYPEIRYVIGHHEYLLLEDSPLFLEIDPTYRTIKSDPGDAFMKKVRKNLKNQYATGRLKKINR